MLRLTLDRVAKEAGVSKGALLYHFPTKVALMEGMLDEVVAAFDARFAHHLPGSQSAAHAAVEAMVDMACGERNLISAVIAAITIEPSLRRKFAQHYQGWIAALTGDGMHPDGARGLTYAIDGVFLMSALGVAPVSEDPGAVRSALLRIARPTEEERLYAGFSEAKARGWLDAEGSSGDGVTA